MGKVVDEGSVELKLTMRKGCTESNCWKIAIRAVGTKQ